ncbi:hypothetical protein [Amycolatopsis nigrescens]|uniref:hypothetical protein n=1 Tax=Amycolatopsis nigrescens TaxID=381445 RepID=UPI0003632278|nr:hypothetical protein [Amycolatopsis nigrescens]
MINVSCAPGPAAAVGAKWHTAELPTLVMYLDPESIAFGLPSIPGGEEMLVRFLRELSREAANLATQMEQKRAIAARQAVDGQAIEGGQHRLRGSGEPGAARDVWFDPTDH